MRAKTTTLLLIVLVMTALAGCLDTADDRAAPATEDTPDPEVPTTSGKKAASTLTANDSVEAPDWSVGDWFGHHVYLQTGDPAGRHYDTVVIEETEDGWLLAADDVEAAKEEAVWDLPVAGAVGRDLATTTYGTEWDLFRFPLHDGKTWDGQVEARDLQQYQLYTYEATFQVVFDDAIDVNGQPLRGYRVTASTADGDLVVDASYIPAVGWYGHITILDVRTDDPDDFFLKTTSMGFGSDWTGTYHRAEAEIVTEHFGGFVAFQPDALAPEAPERFPVPEADLLYGIVVAFAWNGAAAVALADPDGNTYPTHTMHAGTDQEGAAEVWFVDQAAVPGEWSVATAGGGPLWVAGAYLFAVTLHEGSL